MTLKMAGIGLAATLGLIGCSPAANETVEAETPVTAAPATVAAETPSTPAATAAPAPSAPAAPGAPVFAALYPDAEPQGEPVLADGPTGPGGMLTFTTSAQPEAVVQFYKRRAEAAGLKSVMAMNQGETRAYGAAGAEADGRALQVVASPDEAGGASVQLTWSAGR